MTFELELGFVLEVGWRIRRFEGSGVLNLWGVGVHVLRVMTSDATLDALAEFGCFITSVGLGVWVCGF